MATLNSSIQACDKVFQPGHKEFPRKVSPGNPGCARPSFPSSCGSLTCGGGGQRLSAGLQLQEEKALTPLLPLEESWLRSSTWPWGVTLVDPSSLSRTLSVEADGEHQGEAEAAPSLLTAVVRGPPTARGFEGVPFRRVGYVSET